MGYLEGLSESLRLALKSPNTPVAVDTFKIDDHVFDLTVQARVIKNQRPRELVCRIEVPDPLGSFNGAMLNLNPGVVAQRVLKISRTNEETPYGPAKFVSGKVQVRPEYEGLGLGTILMDTSLLATQVLVDSGVLPVNCVAMQVEDQSGVGFTNRWAENNGFSANPEIDNTWMLYLFSE